VRRLVIASDNPGKLREFGALLAPLGADVVAQREFGIRSADEPFETFFENALAKARHAARLSGLPALADDSGLCCVALGGAPGVRSARFAGADADDAANNAELVRRLAGVADRSAHYACVLVAVRAADDPEPVFADAIWRGRFVDEPRGDNGFGYDPHFYVPQFACTAAELPPATKNNVSHRALAMQELVGRLRARWGW
jgi:XTP/dITP diphosphohydrolase